MSIGFIIMHHGGTSLDLPLTPSQSHRSVSSKMTDPGNILCWGGSVSPSTVQHIFPKKITFQSRIWISTCCYGNRHPFLPAGLVWPELVESFKKKKKKGILHISLLFTLKCHWVLSSALAERSFSGGAISWGRLPCQTQPKAPGLLETPCLTRTV